MNANLPAGNSPADLRVSLRKRVFLKSPVREFRTPGSVRGEGGQLPSLPRRWQPGKNLSGVSSNEIADALEKGMLYYRCLYFTGFTKQDIQRMKRIRGASVWKHKNLISLFH